MVGMRRLNGKGMSTPEAIVGDGCEAGRAKVP